MRKEGKERGSPLTKTVSQARRVLLSSFPSSLLTLPPPFPPPPPHASKDKIYVKYHFARASLLLGPGDPVLFFPLSTFFFCEMEVSVPTEAAEAAVYLSRFNGLREKAAKEEEEEERDGENSGREKRLFKDLSS